MKKNIFLLKLLGSEANWFDWTHLENPPRSHHRIEPILEGLSDADSEARLGEKPRRSRAFSPRASLM